MFTVFDKTRECMDRGYHSPITVYDVRTLTDGKHDRNEFLIYTKGYGWEWVDADNYAPISYIQ